MFVGLKGAGDTHVNVLLPDAAKEGKEALSGASGLLSADPVGWGAR